MNNGCWKSTGLDRDHSSKLLLRAVDGHFRLIDDFFYSGLDRMNQPLREEKANPLLRNSDKLIADLHHFICWNWSISILRVIVSGLRAEAIDGLLWRTFDDYWLGTRYILVFMRQKELVKIPFTRLQILGNSWLLIQWVSSQFLFIAISTRKIYSLPHLNTWKLSKMLRENE